jgi:hypothetical protein
MAAAAFTSSVDSLCADDAWASRIFIGVIMSSIFIICNKTADEIKEDEWLEWRLIFEAFMAYYMPYPWLLATLIEIVRQIIRMSAN